MSAPEPHRLPLMLVAAPAVACLIAAGAFLCQLSFLEVDQTKRLETLRQNLAETSAAAEVELAKTKSLADQVAGVSRHCTKPRQRPLQLEGRKSHCVERRRSWTG